MVITSKLTSKAQTTIPQPVRAALNLEPGDALEYRIEAGRVILTNPTHWLVKARKAVAATRRLGIALAAWRAGRISFASFDAGVQGWINHVRYADSWGLRARVLRRFVWSAATCAGCLTGLRSLEPAGPVLGLSKSQRAQALITRR